MTTPQGGQQDAHGGSYGASEGGQPYPEGQRPDSEAYGKHRQHEQFGEYRQYESAEGYDATTDPNTTEPPAQGNGAHAPAAGGYQQPVDGGAFVPYGNHQGYASPLPGRSDDASSGTAPTGYGYASEGYVPGIYVPGAYGQDESAEDGGYGEYRAAVDALNDPLNDPLPGQRSPATDATSTASPNPAGGSAHSGSSQPPWQAPHLGQEQYSGQGQGKQPGTSQQPGHTAPSAGHTQQLGRATQASGVEGSGQGPTGRPGARTAQPNQPGAPYPVPGSPQPPQQQGESTTATAGRHPSPWFRAEGQAHGAGPTGAPHTNGAPSGYPDARAYSGQEAPPGAQAYAAPPPAGTTTPQGHARRPSDEGDGTAPRRRTSAGTGELAGPAGRDGAAPPAAPEQFRDANGRPAAPTPLPASSTSASPETGARVPSPRPGRGGTDRALQVPPPGPGAPGAPPDDRQTVGLRRPEREELASRAERRRSGGHRAKGRAEHPPSTASSASAGTRLEARRAERAQRPGPGIIASRFLGEVFISLGVLMLLFVAYQLWWTNVLADQQAGGAASEMHEQWKKPKADRQPDPERRVGTFQPGEGFALVHLPKLEVEAPIAEGVSKEKVLDKGMVGHYDQAPLKTAMPWDKRGNFALAGHRNTHGEPFRYINRLVVGDKVVVETSGRFYTYEVTSRLPSTSPSNTSVIDPVPPQSGFRKAGRYITLTTCTPEFTSKYRLIVWGRMVDERPRSEGKPDALLK